MSAFTDKLVEAASDEWEFFGRSYINRDGTSHRGRLEYEDGAYLRVNDYWQVVHRLYKPQYGHLTGRDRDWYWSAAFISYCMDAAGAGNSFSYSASHATYVNEAIRAADRNDKSAIYFAHAKSRYSLKPGDLVAYWRGKTKVTIDNARKIGWYSGHCDIVTAVGDRFVEVIGGNVMNSVTKKQLRTNSAGNLTDTGHNWFVVLECQK